MKLYLKRSWIHLALPLCGGLLMAGLLLMGLGLLSGCAPQPATPAASSQASPAAAAASPTSPAPAPTQSLPSPTPTATPLPVEATILEVVNLVDAHAQEGQGWSAAVVDMPLYAGGEVWAKDASTSLLGLGEDRLRVSPNTIFTLRRPDRQTMELNLEQGQIWLNIEGLKPGEEFNINTPAASASVRGTRFSVRVEPDGTTIVSTVVNTVTLSAAGVSVDVGPYHFSRAAPGQPPSPVESMPLEMKLGLNFAAGPGLQIVTPLGELVATYTFETSVRPVSALADGSALLLNSTEYTPLGDGSAKVNDSLLWLDLEAQETFKPELIHDKQVAFKPNAPGVAFVSGYELVCIAPTNDGSQPQCIPASLGTYGQPVWAPDGSAVFLPVHPFGDKADNLQLMTSISGTIQTTLFDNSSGVVGRGSWSGDSRWVAYSIIPEELRYEGPGQLWLRDMQSGDTRLVAEGIAGGVYDNPPVWSPDGLSLVAPKSDGLYRIPLDGGEPERLLEAPQAYYTMNGLRPDGDWPLTFSYFSKSSAEKITSGSLAYFGPGSAPVPIYQASWGPFWIGKEGSLVAYGQLESVDKETWSYRTTVYIFRVEGALWP